MKELPGKKNRTVLVLLLAMILICAILFSLPLYSFQASVYKVKSPNTFVGDETYTAIRTEAEEAVKKCEAQGIHAEIIEDVTERTTTKGEKTSLMEIRVDYTTTRNLWSFFSAGFASSVTLWIMAICALLAAACALFGSVGSLDKEYYLLDRRQRIFRGAAGWLSLFALLALPVFIMMNTYASGRLFDLYESEMLTEGREAFYAGMNRFLLADAKDLSVCALDFSLSGFIWLLLPCFFTMLLCAIKLRFGTVKESLKKGFLYLFIIVVCVITLYPYYVMLATGFRSNAETIDMNFLHIFPTTWQWENLLHIIERGIFGNILNSLLVAGGATVLAMLCGIPAAYALARMKFRGKNAFLCLIIMSQMFSPVVLLIGISQLVNTFGLNDTIWGLMFVNAAFNQAFAVWLLHGTFSSIPPDMENAAMIDGCGRFEALRRVLLPVSMPGIVTALIFVFINAWNEYTVATVLISTAVKQPITVGITQFSSFNMIEWQYLFAASLLATIPVFILFLCIEKHLASGLTSGGVKG